MKETRFYNKLFPVLAAILCLLAVACQKKGYERLVPGDATFVASIDLEQVGRGVKLDSFEPFVALKQTLGSMVDAEGRELLEDVLQDPSLLGFDLHEPAYVFQTPDHQFGLLLKVDESDRVDDVFGFLSKQGLCSKLTDKDGLCWTSLLGDIQLAYNDEALLMRLPTGSDVSTVYQKKWISKIFDNQSDNNIFESKNRSLSADGNGAIHVFALGNGLPSDKQDVLKGLLPKGVAPGSVKIEADLRFDDDGLSLVTNVSGCDEKTQQLLDECDGRLRVLSDDLLMSPAENAFAFLALGCDGKDLLAWMKRQHEVKQMLFMLERAVDIEKMIKAVCGDVCLAVMSPPSEWDNEGENNFMLMVRVLDSSFMDEVDDWRRSARDFGIDVKPMLEKNFYHMAVDGMDLQWGVNDDVLMFATNGAQEKNAFARRSEFADEAHHCKLFACVDMSSLLDSSLQSLGNMLVVRSQGFADTRFMLKKSE